MGPCTRLLTGGPIQRDARSGTPCAEALGTGILRSQNRGKTSTELHWQVLQINKQTSTWNSNLQPNLLHCKDEDIELFDLLLGLDDQIWINAEKMTDCQTMNAISKVIGLPQQITGLHSTMHGNENERENGRYTKHSNGFYYFKLCLKFNKCCFGFNY